MEWPAPRAPPRYAGGVTVKERSATMTIAVLGIDLAKNSGSVAGLDDGLARRGKAQLHRRLFRYIQNSVC